MATHTCRFTAPLELVTDFGSQFVNDLLTHFHQETGIKHHTTTPYSKEENGIVERANKGSTVTYEIFYSTLAP